jgi:xanthine dehydrogenase accessory factor
LKKIYEEILQLETEGGRGILVTVVEKEGHGPGAVGAKMLVLPDGSRIGTVGGGALEYSASNHAMQLLKEGKNGALCGTKKYLMSPDNQLLEGEKTGMLCGGATTLYYERIGSGASIFIFGAGHVGQALIYHLQKMDYFITVADNRKGMADEIENAQQRLTVDSYETAFQGIDVPPDSFFIIATHSHALDYQVLKRIVQTDWKPRYIGMIASKKKAPVMIEQLKEELGGDIDLSKLYSPIGLKIGGASPDEIAISIIAELQAVRYNKEGHLHMNISSKENEPQRAQRTQR